MKHLVGVSIALALCATLLAQTAPKVGRCTASPTPALRRSTASCSSPTRTAATRRRCRRTLAGMRTPRSRWMANGSSSRRIGRARRISSRVHPDGRGLERLTDDPAFDDQATLVSRRTATGLRVHTHGPRRNLAARSQDEGAEQSDREIRRKLPTGLVAGRDLDRVLVRPCVAASGPAGLVRIDPVDRGST